MNGSGEHALADKQRGQSEYGDDELEYPRRASLFGCVFSHACISVVYRTGVAADFTEVR
jgi:hypothetical protein